MRPHDNDVDVLSDFRDVCRNPLLFPDIQKFPVKYARRITGIISTHVKPLQDSCSNHKDVTERLEIPSFEQLWECLYYTKKLLRVGLGRVTIINEKSYTDKGIVDIWNSSIECISFLPGIAIEMCNHLFVWCNDLLIESLQSLIPFKIPYTAWQLIVLHLSTGPDSLYRKSGMLLTKLGTISRGKKSQIVERFFIRECILMSGDLTRNLYQTLYQKQSHITARKMKQKLPLLLNKFCNSMKRLSHFLGSCKPSSGCINYSISHPFYISISDNSKSDEVFGLTLKKGYKPNILKMTGVSTGYQNNAGHFTMFIADMTAEKNLYHILCIDKNSSDLFESEESASNSKFTFILGVLHSQSPPLVHCFGSLVAGIGFEDSTNPHQKTLAVWDISDEGCKGRIFYSDFATMKKSWKNIYSGLNSTLLLDENIIISGMVKFNKTLKVMFYTLPFPSKPRQNPMCVIAEYDLDAFSSRDSFLKPELRFSPFSNALPLGIHKNMAFVMHLETNLLCVYEIKQKGEIVISKTSFGCAKDWKIQFNSNPEVNSCLLYKNNHFQLRNLDGELTLVNEFTLDFDHFSQLYNSFEYQFYDNLLYCLLNNQEDMQETDDHIHAFFESLPDKQSDTFLSRRFLDAHMVHLLVDLDSDEKELVYLDFGVDNVDSSDVVEGHSKNLADLQFCLTGFNDNRELVQLSMALEVCKGINFNDLRTEMVWYTVKFYKSFQDIINLMLPDVEKVIEGAEEGRKINIEKSRKIRKGKSYKLRR